MLSIYRELIKSFPKFMGFDGWMIAKAEFKIIEQPEDTYTTSNEKLDHLPVVKNEIIKQYKKYSVILASMVYKGIGYSVIMHLIKPAGINFGRITETLSPYAGGSVYLFSSEYSKLCIKKFTECTGDNNYIHQAEKPVVPGFLMFEDVLKKVFYINNIYPGLESFKMVFKKPVFADEIINIYKTGSNIIFAMPAQGNKCILWELKYI